MTPRNALLALMLGVGCPAMAQEQKPPEALGRLFMTPEQRLRIDQGVKSGTVETPAAGTGRLDGVVRRSDGRTVVWVDGVPHLEGKRDVPAIAVRPVRERK